MVQSEQELVQAVHETVAPITVNKPHMQVFCTNACVLRFLRAHGMDPTKASAMLAETLEWCATVCMRYKLISR